MTPGRTEQNLLGRLKTNSAGVIIKISVQQKEKHILFNKKAKGYTKIKCTLYEKTNFSTLTNADYSQFFI